MREYLIREMYLSKLRAWRDDTDVIKVITGMRRCGKSVLLEQYMNELKNTGVSEEQIIHIDFEKFESEAYLDRKQLNKHLRNSIKPNRITYIFLDKIQNVEGWELTLSALNAEGNCDVYITGSNSDMLSSQLAAHISGRHVEIKVFPLSFAEFMQLNKLSDRDYAFNQYLEWGGFPGLDIEKDARYRADYLQGVYNTIVIKDIIRHTKVGDPTKVESIVRFLLSNIGNITNKSKIAKATGLPESTVGIYLKAMEESFLIESCDRYDIVGKKILSTNGKYYVADIGLRRAVLNINAGTDISKPLEKLVYLELLRRGYKVRVGSYRDTEVDFLAVRDSSMEYYQVCQTLLSENTRDREKRSLLQPKDNYPKTILALDRLGLGNDEGIVIRNVLDWLME